MKAARAARMPCIAITPEIADIRPYHAKAADLLAQGATIVVPDWASLDRILSPLLGKPP